MPFVRSKRQRRAWKRYLGSVNALVPVDWKRNGSDARHTKAPEEVCLLRDSNHEKCCLSASKKAGGNVRHGDSKSRGEEEGRTPWRSYQMVCSVSESFGPSSRSKASSRHPKRNSLSTSHSNTTSHPKPSPKASLTLPPFPPAHKPPKLPPQPHKQTDSAISQHAIHPLPTPLPAPFFTFPHPFPPSIPLSISAPPSSSDKCLTNLFTPLLACFAACTQASPSAFSPPSSAVLPPNRVQSSYAFGEGCDSWLPSGFAISRRWTCIPTHFPRVSMIVSSRVYSVSASWGMVSWRAAEVTCSLRWV